MSGTGFERDYRERAGRSLLGSEIANLLRAGDPTACAAYDAYLDRLGRAMAVVINILDPDVIVLGGGMSNLDELYADLPSRIEPHVFSDSFTTPVLKHHHGDSSGVRGAAWLWNA